MCKLRVVKTNTDKIASIKTQLWTIIINLFFLFGDLIWSFSVRIGFIIECLTNDSALKMGTTNILANQPKSRMKLKG